MVLSWVGGCYLGDSPPHCAGGRSPPLPCHSPLSFPGAHFPHPPPSTQVPERPLEEGDCDPEEPERRWVRYHPTLRGFEDPPPWVILH